MLYTGKLPRMVILKVLYKLSVTNSRNKVGVFVAA